MTLSISSSFGCLMHNYGLTAGVAIMACLKLRIMVRASGRAFANRKQSTRAVPQRVLSRLQVASSIGVMHSELLSSSKRAVASRHHSAIAIALNGCSDDLV